jgi:acyl carrier protein
MELNAEIKTMIAKALAVDVTDVVSEAHLMDDLGGDSLAILNLATALSKRYSIEIVYDDMVEIESVSELVQLVASKISST